MIKRYTPKNMTWDHPKFEMLENEAGEWVRYDDHMEIMESIGAGGVSRRIISKTLDEHRAEFEAHWHNIQSHGLDNGWLGVAWAAWKAARGITE